MDRSSGRFVFVGGRDRGLRWLTRLAVRSRFPQAVYCLREDDHEVEKDSEAISQLCAEHGIPCRLRRRLTAADEAEISNLRPDLLVVMGWRSLISERVLGSPRFGAVGVHESLLPAYRGFAPVNWAVINGEPRTGVSLFYLTATGVDNGDIVDQIEVPISDEDTASDVYQRTARASIELLDTYLDTLLIGRAPRIPQDESDATYACARTPEDGCIEWNGKSRVIHNLVRGLSHPYPGAFSYFGGRCYRIWSGKVVSPAKIYIGRIPGRIVATVPGLGVEVLAGEGSFLIREASLDGQPPAPAETLFRSVRAGFRDRPSPELIPDNPTP